MATQRAHRAETPAHPNRLWIWEKHVYLDEFRRSWLPVVIKVPTAMGLAGGAAGICPVWVWGMLVAGDQDTEGPLCLKQEG